MTRTLRRLASSLALLLFALLPMTVFAQQQGLEIDIVGGNAAALPIAVVPMPFQGAGAAPGTDVSSIIRADLDRSGQFRSLPDRDMVERPTTGSEVNYPTWRLLKQDFLVVGRVKDAGDGGYRVEYELFDVAKQQRLLGFAMTARSNAMRDVAHQIADAVYEKILGVRGAFWTRIAYVTAAGVGTGKPLRTDGGRFRWRQPADRRALGGTAVVAGMEPGRTQARVRQLRARQFLDLHPGHFHRCARNWSPASAASTADLRFHPMAGNWR